MSSRILEDSSQVATGGTDRKKYEPHLLENLPREKERWGFDRASTTGGLGTSLGLIEQKSAQNGSYVSLAGDGRGG